MKNYANRRLRRIAINVDWNRWYGHPYGYIDPHGWFNDWQESDAEDGYAVETNIPLSNNSYRKYTSPYEISDQKDRTSLNEVKRDAYEELHPTAKDYYYSFVRVKRPESKFKSEQDYINHYTVMYGRK
jgi:hypothetical protein